MKIFLFLFTVVCLLVSSVNACYNASSCWYNGACISGKCVCDKGWKDDDCSQLNLLPAPVKGAYGYVVNVSSWGGGPPILVDGLYHLYVAEMINHCGLSYWTTNSRIIHAISKTLTGPYTFNDEAIGAWSHGPSIAVDNTGPKPKYLLYHIGSGVETQQPAKCSSSSPYSLNQNTNAHNNTSTDLPRVTNWMLHVADSPNGPWTHVHTPGLEDTCNFPSCSMPHAHVFANGSLYLINQQSWSAYKAPSWKGPYSRVEFDFEGNPGFGGGSGWEDPFVWYDNKQTVWKMLFHTVPQPQCPVLGCKCLSMRVGGFAYSKDGIHWIRNPMPPFDNKVTHTDGSTTTFSTMERPKLFFSKNGDPVALFTGVSGNPLPWGCKIEAGVDYTYTLMQPIGDSY